MRTVSFDVPPQEILTKDSVTVAVDAVVYYKIEQPMSAVINVADYASRLNFCIYYVLFNAVSFVDLAP